MYIYTTEIIENEKITENENLIVNEEAEQTKISKDKIELLQYDTDILIEVIKTELKELNKRGPNDKIKGRPKGAKQKKYSYYIEAYDILSKNWMKLGDYFSFCDMSEQLKTVYGLVYTVYTLQNIYSNRSKDQYLRIYHI